MGAPSHTRRAPAPRRLFDSREGAVAVEFALIFPVMLTLFLGSFEVTNLLSANLKMTAATEAAADLAAGATSLTPAQIDRFSAAATLIMSPLAPSGLRLAFASVVYSGPGSTPVVAWHHEQNGAAPITSHGLDGATLEKLGSGSVILVQATYDYSSPLSFVLRKTYSLTDKAYDRPRYVDEVSCGGCPQGR
jgi:Flp pilus assembly protein TadG